LCTDYSHDGPRDNERDRESVGGSGVVVLRSSPGVGAAAASPATTGDCTTKDDDVLAAAGPLLEGVESRPAALSCAAAAAARFLSISSWQ
jgi:hypothetical protein